MKNYLFIFCMLILFSCSSGSDKSPGLDSIDAVGDGTEEDTTVGAFPDGYAPPNAEIDTSARVKDSIRRADSSKQ